MTKYRDIETGETVTEKQLEKEYKELIKNGNIDETVSLEMYVTNCLTVFGGTLEIIHA